jgi:O-antigen/teichoic acid export membrane protein
MGACCLRGLGRVAAASLLDGAAGGAMTLSVQAVILVALSAAGTAVDLQAVLAAMIVGYLPAVAVSLVLARSMLRGLRFGGLVRALRSAVGRHRTFAVIQILGYSGASLEIWLAALTLSRAQASYFGAAQRLALMCAVSLTALQSVASPAISRSMPADDHRLLQNSLRTSASLALVAAGALAAPILLWPGDAMRIYFGHPVTGFSGVVVLLVVGQLVNVATGMCGPVLVMTRFEGTFAVVTAAGLAIRVVVGIPAALLGGAVGLAATATAVSAVGWVYLVIAARAKCRLNTLPTLRPSLPSLRLVRG